MLIDEFAIVSDGEVSAIDASRFLSFGFDLNFDEFVYLSSPIGRTFSVLPEQRVFTVPSDTVSYGVS